MRNPKYKVFLTPKQLRILKLALIEWRNYLIQHDFPTEDVDRILIRLYK